VRAYHRASHLVVFADLIVEHGLLVTHATTWVIIAVTAWIDAFIALLQPLRGRILRKRWKRLVIWARSKDMTQSIRNILLMPRIRILLVLW